MSRISTAVSMLVLAGLASQALAQIMPGYPPPPDIPGVVYSVAPGAKVPPPPPGVVLNQGGGGGGGGGSGNNGPGGGGSGSQGSGCPPCPGSSNSGGGGDQSEQAASDNSDEDCDNGWGDFANATALGPTTDTKSYGPVFYATGGIGEAVADLHFSGPGIAWEHARYYNQFIDDVMTIGYWSGNAATVQVTTTELILRSQEEAGGEWVERRYTLTDYCIHGLFWAINNDNPSWSLSYSPLLRWAEASGLVVTAATPCLYEDVQLTLLGSRQSAQGWNWDFNYSAAHLVYDGSGVYYWHDPHRIYRYGHPSSGGTGGLAENDHRMRSRLFWNHPGDTALFGPGFYRLQKPDGTTWLFYDHLHTPETERGKLFKIVDSYGYQLSFYYSNGKLDHVIDTANRYIKYNYVASGVNTGLLRSVEVWTDESSYTSSTAGTKLAEVSYNYVGDSSPAPNASCGENGDLAGVTVRHRATDETGNDLALVKYTHYRYYKSGSGKVHGLRTIMRPQAVRRALVSDYATFPAILADDESGTPSVSSYTSNEFTFDSRGRVSTEVVRNGISCCGGAPVADGTYSYTYTPTSGEPGVSLETSEVRPDGSTKYVETNDRGQNVLIAVYASGHDENYWHEIWVYYYGGSDYVSRIYTPSAMATYTPKSAGGSRAWTCRDNGLVYLYGYDSAHELRHAWTKRTTGDRFGGVDSTNATYVDYKIWTDYTSSYRNTTLMTGRYVFPTETTTYTNGLLTNYAYEFYTATVRVKVATVTEPAVTTAHNGSGVAAQTRYFYDSGGKVRWAQNPDRSLAYYGYDLRTGQVGLTVLDAHVPDGTYANILPAEIRTASTYVPAWTSGEHAVLPSSFYTSGTGTDHAQLVGKVDYDALTRMRSVTASDGQVGHFAYVNRADGVLETRSYPSWDDAADRPRLPMSRSFLAFDSSGYSRWSENANPTGVSLADPPTGNETWPTALVAKTRTIYNSADELSARREYYDIAGDLYYETKYTYHALGSAEFQGHSLHGTAPAVGRATEIRNPEGGWTFAVYTTGGQVAEIYSTAQESGTPPVASNYALRAKYFYGQLTPDSGVSRYGPLTASYDYYGANYRLTKFHHDWKGRLIIEEAAAAPHTVYKYDNMDRVIATGQYTSVNPESAPDPEADSSSNRVALSTTTYDEAGRVYEQNTYSINAATGAKESGGADKKLLRTRYFYSLGGLQVAHDPPDSGLVILKYDDAGRAVESWLCSEMEHDSASVYSSGVFNYSNSNIKVVEKTLWTLNPRGQVTKVESREVNHDDTDGMGSSDYIAAYWYNWYDAAGRLIDTAYYGTADDDGWEQAGSAPNYGGSAPARSDSVLVTSHEYDSGTGRVNSVTDPKNLVTTYGYDDLGQIAAVVEDYGDSSHLNRRTEYTYDGLGNIQTITAKSAVDCNEDSQYEDETTEYVRADSVDANRVTQVRYPDPANGAASSATADTVAFTYNRDGTIATRRDQNTSVLSYDYDALGRLEHQRATTVATVADSTIRRISYTYNGAGRLEKITSYDNATVGSGGAVNGIKLEYDGFGQLVKDTQDHAGEVDGSGSEPYVQYGHQHADSAHEASYQNYFDRLQTVRYPNGRVVWYDYNHTITGIAVLNDQLSRVGQVADDNSGSKGKVFAQYDYNGVSRMVQRDHLDAGSGNGGKPGNKTALRFLKQSGASGPTYSGFDRFGQVTHLRHVNYNGLSGPEHTSVAQTIDFRYGYDRNGSRMFSKAAHEPGFSHLYAYDNLNRLTDDQLGHYYDGGSGGIISDWAAPAEQVWDLDAVGNWGHNNLKHSGAAANEARTHNATNEIKSRTAVAQGPRYWVSEDFANAGTDGWHSADLNADGQNNDGAWGVSSGRLSCSGVANISGAPGGTGSLVLIDGGPYQDVLLTCTAVCSTGTPYIGLVFGYLDEGNFWIKRYDAPTSWTLYQVVNGTWTVREVYGGFQSGTIYMTAEVRAGSAGGYGAAVPAGRVGLFSSSATGNWFDDFKVRSLAADCAVDGRFTDDVGNVQVSSGKLKFLAGDSQPRQCILRPVRMSEGVVQANLRFRTGMSAGIILNYQDPANYGFVMLTSENLYATLCYYEVVDGYFNLRQVQDGDSVELSDNSDYILRCWTTRSGNDLTMNAYLPDVSANPILANVDVDVTWSGGHVGLWGVPPSESDLLWDDFKCGIDNTPMDGSWLSNTEDYVYADYNFDGAGWNTLTFSYDDNGNLTNDGLLKYEYDVWNRLVGAWYAGSDMSDGNERLATYKYDGLSRRLEKIVANQGTGVVSGSDASSIVGIQAGNRHEHYYYDGWRIVEMRDNSNHALGQFVYGTEYMDEPIRYDRNMDVGGGSDTGCLDAGSKAYFYHQDANYRVVMLTGEDASVVERFRYTAYGEPIAFGGYDSRTGAESGGAMLASSIGNPFLHHGLFWDRPLTSFNARHRCVASAGGRFHQRDPIGYLGGSLSLYEYSRGSPVTYVDPIGLQSERPTVIKHAIACEKGKRKDIPREKADRVLNPDGDPGIAAQLDLGCIGLAKHYQNGTAAYPEDEAGTTCYAGNDEAAQNAACKQTCPDGQSPFVFSKQGQWADGKGPDPNGVTRVKGTAITRGGSDVPFNYVSVYKLGDGTKCYAWMDHGKRWGPQTVSVNDSPPNDPSYPAKMWCVTCR